MNEFVRDGHRDFTVNYVQNKDSNGNVERCIKGLEYVLLKFVCEQRNMSFFHVSSPEGFEMEVDWANKLIGVMTTKEAYITSGGWEKNICLYHILIPQIPTT